MTHLDLNTILYVNAYRTYFHFCSFVLMCVFRRTISDWWFAENCKVVFGTFRRLIRLVVFLLDNFSYQAENCNSYTVRL